MVWRRVIIGVWAGILIIFGAASAQPAHAARSSGAGHPLPSIRLAALPQTTLQRDATPPGNFPFTAQTSADGLVTLHYYATDPGYAQSVLAIIAKVLQSPIKDTLGFTLQRHVDIYAYTSQADFLAGAAVANPEEVGAYSQPDQNAVYLPITTPSDPDTTGTLAHELTHIVFHQNEDIGHLQAAIGFYPLWLDEGLATYDESVDPISVQEYQSAVTDAVRNHQFLDLLTGFAQQYPSDPDTNYTGYAEAHAFIAYLCSTYGLPMLHQFLAALHDGAMDLAAMQVYHANMPLLEHQWAASLGALPANVAGYAAHVIPPTPFAMGTADPRLANLHPAVAPDGGSVAGSLFAYALTLTLILGFITWLERQRRSRALPPIPIHEDVILLQTEPPPEPRLPWADIALTLAPLATFIVGIFWALIDPQHLWRHGELVAGGVGLLATVVLLIMTRRVQQFSSWARYVSIVILVLLVSIPFSGANALGQQQAAFYERRSYDAFALMLDADAGASAQTLANLHLEWAHAAIATKDYATGIAQLRAAYHTYPSIQVATETQHDVLTWGDGLRNAGKYSDAIQVFIDQAKAPSCDSPCVTALNGELATTYHAWGDTLFVNGDFAGAAAKYHYISQNFATTTDATSMPQAQQESAARAALNQAWTAGQTGDASTMNTQLRVLAQQYPTTDAASAAHATPEPVSGHITDLGGYTITDHRIFFYAYTSRADAAQFADDAAYAFATTLDGRNNFTTRLLPGYWYVGFWTDPSLATDRVYTTLYSANGIFTVQPYTPLNVGTLSG